MEFFVGVECNSDFRLRPRSFSKQLLQFFSIFLYSSTTLAVAVTLPGSSETASSSARLFASASGAPPHPEGQLLRAAALLSKEARAPPKASSLLPLPLRLKAGSRFPPRKTRCPPVAMDAGGPQWESTTREREEEEEKESSPFSSSSEEKEPSRHAGGVTSRTTEGPTHTTACGGLDSTAQRPPSATSSNDGAEQTGSRRRGEEEEGEELFPSPPPPPGKRVAAEHTGLAFAVADAVAAELAPPEVVEAAAAAVEATAALSAASASDLGEEDRRAAKNVFFLAPAGRKGLPPPTPPLKRGSSQSSRLVATSVRFFVRLGKREYKGTGSA